MKFLEALKIFTEKSPTKFEPKTMAILSIAWSVIAIAVKTGELEDVCLVDPRTGAMREFLVNDFLKNIGANIDPEIRKQLIKAGVEFDEINDPNEKKSKKSKTEKKLAEKAELERLEAEKEAAEIEAELDEEEKS